MASNVMTAPLWGSASNPPDDSATSLRVPVYGGITRVPYHFADSVGQLPDAAVSPKHAPKADALNPSWDSAFWIWNLVSNLCYGERAELVTEALREEMGPLQRDLIDKSVAFEAKVVQEYYVLFLYHLQIHNLTLYLQLYQPRLNL